MPANDYHNWKKCASELTLKEKKTLFGIYLLNISKLYMCNLLATQIFAVFYLKKEKKTLVGTSNSSKIFQSVFDVKQIHISTF